MTPFEPSKRAQRGRSSIIREILRLTQRGDVLSLAGGIPAMEALPLEELRAAAAELDVRAFQYTPTEGLPELVGLLAGLESGRLGRTVPATEILVTGGSQQALDLLGRVLLDPGDLVAIEHPGYLGAIQALEAYEPVFLPVAVDADGMDVDALERSLCEGARPKLVYTVPDFSNPTGAVLAASRRAHLAALAERYGFLIVEDDPYGHLRFGGEPLRPLARLSTRVVRLSTVSKMLAPGLRVGWVTGPRELIGLLVRAKQAADLQASTTGQALAAALLGRPGWLEAQIARIVPLYRARADGLTAALRTYARDGLTVEEPRGGMFLWARLTMPHMAADELLGRALRAGVAFVPGSAFAVPGGAPITDGLRLSYATLAPPELSEAARRLGIALADR